MKTIGAILCVLNEAEFIADSIGSIADDVDQLIVIDQGSTDGTQNIVDELNVEWISTLGQNFLTRGERFWRQLRRDLCFCDYLLVLDGDEIMGDGWAIETRRFIEGVGDLYGAVRCHYHQLIVTSEYCTPDSPLTPEGGCQPFLIRMHDNLDVGPHKEGTLVHAPFINFHPPMIANLSGVDCWHMGYCKSDLTARLSRNIERGDWTQNEEHKAEFFAAAREEPLNLLPECVPVSDEIRQRMPASVREPKFDCEYCPETRRIVGRKPRNL